MRLDVAGPAAAAFALEQAEDTDARDRRKRGRADGNEAALASVDQEHDAERIPKPSVAEPGGKNRQDAKPARGAPAVEFSHQAVIVRLDLVPDRPGYSHSASSIAGWGMAIPARVRALSGWPRIRAAQRRLKESSLQ